MTVLWFSLAVVSVLLGVGLVLLDKRLHAGARVSEAREAPAQVAEPASWAGEHSSQLQPFAPEEAEGQELTPHFVEPTPDQREPYQQPALVQPLPVTQLPAAQEPAASLSVSTTSGTSVRYETHSHVHNYNAPVYNGPVYNGPVYIEAAQGEDQALALRQRRKGILDRLIKSERHKRQQWANERNFQYQASDSALVRRWRRGVFAARQARAAQAVVRAETDIGILEFFDVDDLVAIAALHTEHPSSVVVELRAGWAGPPVLADVTRVGELGGYEVHASDVGAGQRFLWDPRLEGFIARLPQFVRVLWNEGPWVLAELPLDIPDEDLDGAAVVVRELADLLRVLPPELDPEPVDRGGFDPGAPQGQLPRWAGPA